MNFIKKRYYLNEIPEELYKNSISYQNIMKKLESCNYKYGNFDILELDIYKSFRSKMKNGFYQYFYYFKVRCNLCTNKTIFSTAIKDIFSNHTKSCGCLTHNHKEIVRRKLDKNNWVINGWKVLKIRDDLEQIKIVIDKNKNKSHKQIVYVDAICPYCKKLSYGKPFYLIGNLYHSVSCGCSNYLKIKNCSLKTHNLSYNKYYKLWINFNRRCYETSDHYHYKDYGARGIYVCDEWRWYSNRPDLAELNRRNYFNFANWYDKELKRLGLTFEEVRKLNYTIDRIDNDGPYAPWNCRLATPKEQSNNQVRKTGITHALLHLLFDVITTYNTGEYVYNKEWKITKDNIQNKEIVVSKDGTKYFE